MRFMVSLVSDDEFYEQVTPEQMQEIGARMKALNDELERAGVLVDGGRLGPGSETRTLRYGEDGEVVVTDGPFAESKEQIAGYWIFECEDLDEAIGWLEKAPAGGRAMEVRPII